MVITGNRTRPAEMVPTRTRAPLAGHDHRDLPDLVAGAVVGDPAAWRTLMERFSGMVLAVARSCRLGDADAWEVHQITWLRLVEHIGRIEQPDRIGGWLATTARRESLRVVRFKSRMSLDHDGLVQVANADDLPVDTGLLAGESAALVRQAFARLPAHCQRLLGVLMDNDPPSYKEISESISIPIGSIGPTRGRCLDHLRRIMEELGAEV